MQTINILLLTCITTWLLCLSNVFWVQRQELVVELWRRSCVTLPWYTYNKYFKGFPGLNSVNTKVYRKVFNTKHQTFRSTPLKPMISSNNPTATDFRIHHLFQSLFHKFKFAITEVFNFQCNWCFFSFQNSFRLPPITTPNQVNQHPLLSVSKLDHF